VGWETAWLDHAHTEQKSLAISLGFSVRDLVILFTPYGVSLLRTFVGTELAKSNDVSVQKG
jgi:hypothetical protein